MAYTHDLLEETTGWLRRVCIDDKGKKKPLLSVQMYVGAIIKSVLDLIWTASYINKIWAELAELNQNQYLICEW